MHQLAILCLLTTALPLPHECSRGHFHNITANEKTRHDIAKLVEDYDFMAGKRLPRSQSRYPIVPNYWGHGPANPQFSQMLAQMNHLIPAKLTRRAKGHLVKDTLNIIKGLRIDQADNEEVLEKLEELEAEIIDLKSSRSPLIVEKLSELFSYLENIQHYGNPNKMDDDPWSLAPFTNLGRDCFADVNHQEISWEIRRIALAMSKYIEDRILETPAADHDHSDAQRIKYKTDAILTQMVVMMAKLHRATVRNWHHILMVISNFAYIQETGIDDLLHEEFDL